MTAPMQLNPEQALVAAHVDGPMRVAAFAGSGKTSALIERVAFLVEKKGVRPDSILLITFSTNAKNEMKKRLNKRMPGAGLATCARTFHSIGLHIYKEQHADDDQTYLDTSGMLWVRTIFAAYRATGTEPEKKGLKRFSSLLKNDLIGTSPALRRLGKVDPRVLKLAKEIAPSVAVSATDLINAFYKAEDIRTVTGIEHEGAYRTFLTFDDMIYESAMLLRQKEVRERWSRRWRYVMQDEAQDVNAAQAAIAEALCSHHRNYVVVGDPSQCIFQFRGSRPQKLLAFTDEWPGAKTVTMFRNYRSGVEIVEYANKIVDHMPVDTVVTDDMGITDPMTSERQTRAFVGYHVFEDPSEEAENVATNILAHNEHDDVRWRDQAVIVRMNRMTRDIEVALAAREIPYKLVSGTSFFGLKETVTLYSYLRLLAQRASGSDLDIALRTPSRGIGRAFVKNVHESREGEESWIAVVRRCAATARRRTAVSAIEWCDYIEAARRLLVGKEPADVLIQLRCDLGLDDHFTRQGDEAEDNDAMDNLTEAIAFARHYDSVTELLDAIERIESHRKATLRKRDVVRISTVHKAKGEEYPIVYVLQVADGFFPTTRGDVAEERRCFYVACTRAMDELWISRPATSSDGEPLGDSMFLRETKLEAMHEYNPGRAIEPMQVGTQIGLGL